MPEVLRRSSVSFRNRPVQTELRDGWEVVLEYEGEGDKKGPFLIDLSHRAKWDVQSADLERIQPWGLTIPDRPGECVFQNGFLIGRMNRIQAACWNLVGGVPERPDGTMYTETTDAYLLLALLGRELFPIMEKVCSLDFHSPRKRLPFLFQAPVLRLASQVVFLGENAGVAAILLSCARGYGHTMVQGILHAGAEQGLRPAGERTFSTWLTQSSI